MQIDAQIADFDQSFIARFAHGSWQKVVRADKRRAEQRAWVAVNFERRTFLLDFAFIHQQHVVGDRERLTLVVRNQYRRAAGLPVNGVKVASVRPEKPQLLIMTWAPSA